MQILLTEPNAQKNIRIFIRIIAEGIEMTIFRFDFQDQIVLVSIVLQPVNRFVYS